MWDRGWDKWGRYGLGLAIHPSPCEDWQDDLDERAAIPEVGGYFGRRRWWVIWEERVGAGVNAADYDESNPAPAGLQRDLDDSVSA